jgi:hypothetical protein
VRPPKRPAALAAPDAGLGLHRREPKKKTKPPLSTVAPGSGAGSQPRARQATSSSCCSVRTQHAGLGDTASTAEPKTKTKPPLSAAAGSRRRQPAARAPKRPAASLLLRPRNAGLGESACSRAPPSRKRRRTAAVNRGARPGRRQPAARQSDQHLLVNFKTLRSNVAGIKSVPSNSIDTCASVSCCEG